MSSSNSNRTVPIPTGRRFRFWRQRFLPSLVWVGAVLCTVLLVGRQTHYITAVGVVELDSAAVSPLMDGTVRSVSVDLLDPVESGQIVVLMDDAQVAAELAVAEAELTHLRAALEAEEERLQLELATETATQQDDLRRFVLNEETARLDLLDRLVQQETDEVEVQRLEVLLGRQEKLLEEGLIDEAACDEIRLSYRALQTGIRENEASIAFAREQLERTGTRLDEREETKAPVLDQEEYLSPFQQAIAVQEARVREINGRRTMLALRAPLAGQVNTILHQPGETILSGTPVLTITNPNSTRVVAYVDEHAPHTLTRGAEVELRSRQNPRVATSAKLIKVGAQIEPMPLRLSRNPIAPQWGVQLLLGEIPADVFLPGEILDLRLPRQSRR